ncbi:MAG: carbon monoxide dehydrogenase, partial [Thermoleophilia bacterium]
AEAIRRLAGDIGIARVALVVNKVTAADADFCRRLEQDFDVLGCLPFSEEVRQADLNEAAPFDAAPEYVRQVETVLARLEERG